MQWLCARLTRFCDKLNKLGYRIIYILSAWLILLTKIACNTSSVNVHTMFCSFLYGFWMKKNNIFNRRQKKEEVLCSTVSIIFFGFYCANRDDYFLVWYVFRGLAAQNFIENVYSLFEKIKKNHAEKSRWRYGNKRLFSSVANDTVWVNTESNPLKIGK